MPTIAIPRTVTFSETPSLTRFSDSPSSPTQTSSPPNVIESLRLRMEEERLELAERLSPGLALAASVSRRGSVAFGLAGIGLERRVSIAPDALSASMSRKASLPSPVSRKGSVAFGLAASNKDEDDTEDDRPQSASGSILPYNSSRYASAYSLTFEDPVTESETDDEADGQPQSSPNIEEQVADSDKADEPQPQLKKLTYKERLAQIQPKIPTHKTGRPRRNRSHITQEELQRAEAIVALLEKKRAEFKEQRAKEILEHSARAKARRERLTGRKEREQPTPSPIKPFEPLYPATTPKTYRNPIPTTWTETLWYKEIVEQMHRNHPHHQHHRLADIEGETLKRIPSRDVVFGRLLTPGVKAFRDDNTAQDVERKVPGPVHTFLRQSSRRKRKRVKGLRLGVGVYKRRQTVGALPPLPLPSMPSLTRTIKISDTSETAWHEGEIKLKDSPRKKTHYRFTRMANNLLRNKETALDLLTMDRASDEEADIEVRYSIREAMTPGDANASDARAFGADTGYDIFLRKKEKEEGEKKEEIPEIPDGDTDGIMRLVVSASRRGAAAVGDFIGRGKSADAEKGKAEEVAKKDETKDEIVDGFVELKDRDVIVFRGIDAADEAMGEEDFANEFASADTDEFDSASEDDASDAEDQSCSTTHASTQSTTPRSQTPQSPERPATSTYDPTSANTSRPSTQHRIQIAVSRPSTQATQKTTSPPTTPSEPASTKPTTADTSISMNTTDSEFPQAYREPLTMRDVIRSEHLKIVKPAKVQKSVWKIM